VRIAIDNFGTARSSLAVLRSLPAGIVKIDLTFGVARAAASILMSSQKVSHPRAGLMCPRRTAATWHRATTWAHPYPTAQIGERLEHAQTGRTGP
jgi:hypothetical protein